MDINRLEMLIQQQKKTRSGMVPAMGKMFGCPCRKVTMGFVWP